MVVALSFLFFPNFNFLVSFMKKAQASLEYSGMIALDNKNGDSEVEIKLIH